MRLPLAPLLAALPPVLGPDGPEPAPTVTNAYRTLGVGHNRLRRWERDGLTMDEADDVAGRLKRHPSEIWPEWVEFTVANVERVCEADGCEERFVPGRGGKRFCSRRCVMRQANARYIERHRDAVLARARANAARYYAENGDYVRARQRRYDEARRAGRRRAVA